MYILETTVNNAKLRKNYKCNEETDYFNRAGHNCYDDNSNIISTILIGLAIIVVVYLIYFIVKKIRKKRKEKQKTIEESNIKNTE